MGFWNKVKNKLDNYQYETAEKEKGKNLYLLNKSLPKDANHLIIKGYENAKLSEEKRQIRIRRMKEEAETLKVKQKLDQEKFEHMKIKNKINKERGDDFSF